MQLRCNNCAANAAWKFCSRARRRERRFTMLREPQFTRDELTIARNTMGTMFRACVPAR